METWTELDDPALELEAEIEKSHGLAPKPPREETDGRLERVRAGLESRGLDALLVFGSAGAFPEPARYLAGYVHVFPTASSFLLVPREADPVLLIDQRWHLPEARKMSWIEDIRVFPNGSRRWLHDELKAVLADTLKGARLNRAKIGIIDVELPIVYFRVLTDALPGARFEDARPAWDEIVGTPSKYDIEMMRQTVSMADRGHAAAVKASAAGVAEHEVCFAAYRAMVELGAEFLHGSGFSTHVNIGSHSDAISNVRPFLFTANRLEQGQMFWFDLTCSYAGYYNDCCRTISLGSPTAKQREIYEVCVNMYNAMLEAVRPGVPGGQIYDVGQKVANEAGYGAWVNHVYFGHTTGIATSVRPVIARGETAEIRPNSFLNIEPGVFVPGVGSASVENALWVSETGAESVNQFGIELHVR